MTSGIESAADAVQVFDRNQLRLGVRPEPSGESDDRHNTNRSDRDGADKVNIKDSLFRAANLNLEVQGDEQRQPEERASSTNLEYQRREATVLRLRTQEGDVVKLKLRNVETTSVQADQQVDGETVISELALNTSSRTRLRISVQGNINDAELAAIQSVAEQASQLAGSFFGGNLNDAFQAASDFAIDGSQLAKVSLRLSVRERLNFAQTAVTNAQAPAATVALPPADVADEAAAPTSQAATVVPKVVSSTAPAVARTDVPLPAAPVTTTNTATATDEPSEAPPAEDAPLAQPTNLLDAFQALADFLNSIATFIEDLLSSFNAPAETESSAEASLEETGGSSAFSFRFKLDLFTAVLTGLEPSSAADEPAEGEPAEAERLVTDTLAAVAQEVDPQSVSDLA